MVVGILFGWFAAVQYKNQKDHQIYKDLLERTPTGLLKVELNKRGNVKETPFRG